MRNCHRAATRNLRREQRNYRATGAQHVSKAYSHEACAAVLSSHRLHDQFSQSFACTHNIRRIDRFVRGYEHKAGSSDGASDTGGIQCSQYIGAQGFDFVQRLHEWHVLIRRSVEHYRRPVKTCNR